MADAREVFGEETAETVRILEWARVEAGYTQHGLARRAGVDKSTVKEYLQGRRPNAGWLFVVRWLKACGFRVVIERRADAE